MVAVRVFIEGGGSTRFEQKELREGFSKLFGKVVPAGRRPSVVCGGGRGDAYKDFCQAQRSGGALEDCLLLVDSEEAVRAGVSRWDHVRDRPGDAWDRPAGATDQQLHFMVQAMEAWLVADPEALAAFYGQGFKKDKLPRRQNKEDVPKTDLYAALEHATRSVRTKGTYGKSHGFALIAAVDPAKVSAACPYAERFFDALRARTSE